MKEFIWRLRYAYTMQVYAHVPPSMAWAMSKEAYADYDGFDVKPSDAAMADVEDWAGL